jgi:phosphatidylglycerol:prolipoprotein diacylglycerol transferase
VNIGPITIYSYGFFVASAVLLALWIAHIEAKHRGLQSYLVPDLGFYLILGAIVGARLLYVLLNIQEFLAHPLAIIQFWKGGLVFFGGAVVSIVIGWIYLRWREQPFWVWTDAFAPGIAAGQALGRVGCLMAGCCYGKPTEVPWAITFTNPDSLAPLFIPLHPTQMYHSLAGLITFIVLCIFKRRLTKPGQLFSLFLMCYGIFRLTIEFFRGDFRGYLGILSFTQWGAIAMVLLGLSFFWYQRRRALSV